MKYLYTSGAEECVFTDGTVERISVDGEKVVEFPNGQRETYTKLFKVRLNEEIAIQIRSMQGSLQAKVYWSACLQRNYEDVITVVRGLSQPILVTSPVLVRLHKDHPS